MRKYLLSAVAFCITAGLALAADAVFVKLDKDKKELTVKEGDKEKTYKITDDTKVMVGDKTGNVEQLMKRLEKAKEGKTKFEITTDKDKLTEIKFPGKK